MSETAECLSADEAIYETDFVREMLRQLRAIDTYDTYENWSVAQILDPLVMTKERKAEIPIVGDPDDIVMSRVKAYYNAIACCIEARTGKMAVPMISLSHEGFGRVLITVGKLVAVDRTLRDVHRFGFKSLEKMVDEAEKFISKAVGLVEKYPQVVNE